MRSRVYGLVLGAAIFAFGCDGGESSMDGGIDGRVPEVDGGLLEDGGPADAGPVDGGPRCGERVCGEAEACVRSVCLARCGADLSGWDEALAAGLTPVASYCRAADVSASHVGAGSLEVWDLRASAEGTTTSFVLSRWTPAGATPVATEVARAAADTGSAEVLLFPGGYLAVSPDRGATAFGYTTTAAGFQGEIFRVLTADGATVELDAPGNFGAAWLDASTLLVNGFGVDGVGDGQGLYAVVFSAGAADVTQVASGLGIASGGVHVAADHVLVGGLFEGFENRAYALDRALVQDVVAGRRDAVDVEAQAGTTAGVHRVAALPSTFDGLGDAVAVQEWSETFELTGLLAYPVRSYAPASGLALDEPQRLTSGATFRSVLDAGAGRVLLVHERGLLLVER